VIKPAQHKKASALSVILPLHKGMCHTKEGTTVPVISCLTFYSSDLRSNEGRTRLDDIQRD